MRELVNSAHDRGPNRSTGPAPLSFVSRTATAASRLAASTQSPPLPVLWLDLRQVPTSTQLPPLLVL